jgi:hypothetical protein
VRKPLAAVVLLLALAPSALAATPAVTADQQQQMKTVLGMLGADDLAYVPSLVPPHYVETTSQTSGTQITLTFTNSKCSATSAKANASALNFSAQPYKHKLASCANGSNAVTKFQGKTIYVKAQDVVWRCVRAPSGHLVVVFANSPTLGYSELVRIVASAVHIS